VKGSRARDPRRAPCAAPNTSGLIGLRSISVNESGYARVANALCNATVREPDRALYNVIVGELGSSVHFG
jgi:hypothetical protein